jgi:hypothetical protein
MMKVTWMRTLRTASSERLLARAEGRDVAAVDLHHLEDGVVAGTVVVLRDAGLKESDVPALLSDLDENWLPGVDLARGNLTFTVVMGDVMGSYEAIEEAHD